MIVAADVWVTDGNSNTEIQERSICGSETQKRGESNEHFGTTESHVMESHSRMQTSPVRAALWLCVLLRDLCTVQYL